MAAHRTNVSLAEPVPLEVEAGASLVLAVEISCVEGCSMRGVPVEVLTAAERLAASSEPDLHDEARGGARRIPLAAPAHAGSHLWTIRVPVHEGDGVVHEEARLDVAFTTVPHSTSMAVWDLPAPGASGRPFEMKVGVTCEAGCRLAERLVEVCDESGARIGVGRLADAAWPGTRGLHVAAIQLTAPDTVGTTWWVARYPACEPGLPHEPASAAFSLLTAPPPEHRVTVRIADKDTAAPIDNAAVRLGPYRASTNAEGFAMLELPGGVYDVDVWKAGYETPRRTVDVRADLTIQLDAASRPEPDPDDNRVWM